MVDKLWDPLSWVPMKVSLYYDEQSLSIGTAFIYSCLGKNYLVTNWHNVTGRHSETLKPLNKNAGIPNKIHITIPKKINSIEDGEPMASWNNYIINLYDNDKPIWYEHPEHKQRVDVVVIPMDIGGSLLVPANDESLKFTKLVLRPSLDVYVLGYPRGLTGGANFPVWKRGSIASEPNIDINDLPKLYIDTATREGMSGAPVYAENNGFTVPEGCELKNAVIGQARKFVGIYSGRIGDDSFLAQLGIVWKEKAICEVIEGETIGKSSFDLV